MVENAYSEYIPDVGPGFESPFELRKMDRFVVSAIVAKAFQDDGSLEARISIQPCPVVPRKAHVLL